MINLKASNISELAKGKIPKILVDEGIWEEVLKIIDKWPKFVAFDDIIKVATTSDGETTDITEEKWVNTDTNKNPFEERSKVVKAKLNGKTHIDK